MKSNRFVLDTNTLVSALIFGNSKPGEVLNKVRELGTMATSVETFAEISEVILRPKFDRYISSDRRNRFLLDFKKEAIILTISESITACRDPKDDKFLELAVAANASCIITGDDDLLVLHPFRKIPILKTSDFLIQF